MPGGRGQIKPYDGVPFKKGDTRICRIHSKKMNLDKLLRIVLMERINNQTAIKLILTKLREMALTGDLKAIEMLLDRFYGKPKQRVESTGPAPIIAIQYVVPDGNKTDNKAAPSLGSSQE